MDEGTEAKKKHATPKKSQNFTRSQISYLELYPSQGLCHLPWLSGRKCLHYFSGVKGPLICPLSHSNTIIFYPQFKQLKLKNELSFFSL